MSSSGELDGQIILPKNEKNAERRPMTSVPYVNHELFELFTLRGSSLIGSVIVRSVDKLRQ